MAKDCIALIELMQNGWQQRLSTLPGGSSLAVSPAPPPLLQSAFVQMIFNRVKPLSFYS